MNGPRLRRRALGRGALDLLPHQREEEQEWELVTRPDPVIEVYPLKLQVEVRQAFHLPLYTAVRLQSGVDVSRPIHWLEGVSHTIPTVGTHTYVGALATEDPDGAPAPVRIEVEALPYDPEKTQLPDPEMRMLGIGFVRLVGDGQLSRTQRARTAALLSINDDQLLYAFRLTCGLDTRSAPPMDGWDNMDCKLRGHTTGHVLSALSVGYAATGDPGLRAKLAKLVQGLLECQDKFARLQGYHPGYVGAFSEEQFDDLEKPGASYPSIWAPWYTLHKLMAGALDAVEHASLEDALQVARGLGLWSYQRLSRLTHVERQQILSIHIAGEFGGMNECLAQLYGYTSDERLLSAASWFNKDQLLTPMVQGVDALTEMHANTHVPQVLGLLEQFRRTGVTRYKDLAQRFWGYLVPHHCYSNGGVGQCELFYPPHVIATERGEETAETCVSYNMLKLTARLAQYDPRPEWGDYYELVSINHTLASTDVGRIPSMEMDPSLDVEGSDRTMYYFPTQSGAQKIFDTWEDNTCCHASGMEVHYRWAEGAFYHSKHALHVSQYSSCRISAKGMQLAVYTSDEHPDQVQLSIDTLQKKEVHFRVPNWARGSYAMMDGQPVALDPTPGRSDLILGQRALDAVGRKGWEGAKITLNFGIGLGLTRCPDRPELASVTFGPYVLAALSDAKTDIPVPCDEENMDLAFKRSGSSLRWTHRSGLVFVPVSLIVGERYTLYVDVSLPLTSSRCTIQ